ncbi:MAG TPA: response regulator [Verrucomicrobiae bacterium]|jgi:CheY-like chemotaxis protein|nr:response regulator [Verrucomicrobiae bacterium]
MNEKNWSVCVIEPNKYEAQIVQDMLYNAGVDKYRIFTDANLAMEALESFNANIVLATFELGKQDGAAWTRAFRRNQRLMNRKAAVFLLSGSFSRTLAETCRHAGANALIGKPISNKALLETVKKVLAAPRDFIDAEGYVGPCRRAGIVTAGTGASAGVTKRRKADKVAEKPAAAAGGMPTLTFEQAVGALGAATAQFKLDLSSGATCEAALRFVQAYAVAGKDHEMMRACAAFAQQIIATKSMPADVARVALDACVNGVNELAKLPAGDAKRTEVAEHVRQTVAKAAMQKAA